MTSDPFKNVTDKLFFTNDIIYMYKRHLASNNPQGLIYH